jgi:hypothetical protein
MTNSISVVLVCGARSESSFVLGAELRRLKHPPLLGVAYNA